MRKLPWVNPMTTFGVFVNHRDGSLIDRDETCVLFIITFGIADTSVNILRIKDRSFNSCLSSMSSRHVIDAHHACNIYKGR